jgi:aldehyde dehydrogenase (NAD+)
MIAIPKEELTKIQLEDMTKVISNMRSHFDEGHTLPLESRKKKLQLLEKAIERYTEEICDAIFQDFHKPKAEMLLTEIYTSLAEVRHTISKLSNWAAPERAATNLLIMPASSKIYKSPKGVVCLFAPWNYPFYLAMMPLISAIAAGNVVILKPAHETLHVSRIINKILSEIFDKKEVFVVEGEGKTIGDMLLNNFKFDHIFFTGSQAVGKSIMEKAAKNLTPVTLELGGKSPSIIDENYDVNYAAKKIVWAKFINAGQTCVCTDYALVHARKYDAFIEACKKQIELLFGTDVANSDEYGHIINQKRYDRIIELMKDGDILYGGQSYAEKLCIAPTLLAPHSLDTAIMKEEIFGPVLPIIKFESEKEVVNIVRRNRHPLALYIFSTNKKFRQNLTDKIEFGGGCYNNNAYHLGNPSLPFGGAGSSGMGSYHGKYGFDTFSHSKSVLNSAKWFDIPLLYQPYTLNKMKVIKWFFRQ